MKTVTDHIIEHYVNPSIPNNLPDGALWSCREDIELHDGFYKAGEIYYWNTTQKRWINIRDY